MWKTTMSSHQMNIEIMCHWVSHRHHFGYYFFLHTANLLPSSAAPNQCTEYPNWCAWLWHVLDKNDERTSHKSIMLWHCSVRHSFSQYNNYCLSCSCLAHTPTHTQRIFDRTNYIQQKRNQKKKCFFLLVSFQLSIVRINYSKWFRYFIWKHFQLGSQLVWISLAVQLSSLSEPVWFYCGYFSISIFLFTVAKIGASIFFCRAQHSSTLFKVSWSRCDPL